MNSTVVASGGINNMFNHYHVSSGPSYTETRITEKRAPTDESVRLLREMESEARKKIIESVRLERNTLNCVVHRAEDIFSNKTLFRIMYDINGNKRTIDFDVLHDDYIRRDIRAMQEKIWEEVSKDLALFLCINFVEVRK